MYNFIQALSNEEKYSAFKLRYEVYCAEKKWLEPQKYPEKIEVDEEDQRADLFLAIQAETGIPVGTFRLIVNHDDTRPLPIARHPALKEMPATGHSVEISRFLVMPHVRRGEIFIGMIRQVFRHVLACYPDFEWVFFAVEPRFLKIVNSLGFEFQPFAPAALWYGDELVPSRQAVNTLEKTTRENHSVFSAWLWSDPTIMGDEKLRDYLRMEKLTK